jgi:hypothetical protein
MRYTKNIGLRLRENGFKYDSGCKQKESKELLQSELDYEVWKKKLNVHELEITVDHIAKKVSILLDPCEVVHLNNVKSFEDLEKLKKLIKW